MNEETQYLREIIFETSMLVQAARARDWDCFRESLEAVQGKTERGRKLEEVRYILFNGDDGGLLGIDIRADPVLLENMERISKEVEGRWES